MTRVAGHPILPRGGSGTEPENFMGGGWPTKNFGFLEFFLLKKFIFVIF
jgi:hypothetical protein